MPELDRGRVRANNLTFEYLSMGDGPLALCVHGFPDSPHSYRYLLPALAETGYRAVAPFNRGFAPTELPDDRHHVHTSMMVNDQIALHEALGGDGDAVLIAHDWGAVGAWGAAAKAPERWRLLRHDPGAGRPGARALRPGVTIRTDPRRRPLLDGPAPDRRQQAHPGLPERVTTPESEIANGVLDERCSFT